MPRKSPIVIRLSCEERRMFKQRCRQYTSSYRDFVRARIVLLAAYEWENQPIGERQHTPRSVVSKLRQRLYRDRLAGLEKRSRGRRSSTFLPSGRRARESVRL